MQLRNSLAIAGLLAALTACGNKPAGPVDPVEGLAVQPDGATIDDGTTLQLRARGVRRSGGSSDLGTVKWSAEGSATVDDNGLLTPSGTGTVTVTATSQGLTGMATVEIIAAGAADVRVIDATTGEPINGANVRVGSESDVVTGSDGLASVTGAFSGAIDVTVWADGYWPLTVRGATVRNLVLPIRPQTTPEPGTFNGKIGFESAFGSPDPPSGSLYLGFAAASLSGNILAFNFEDLLGDNRPISLGGIEVDAPSNIYVHNVTSDYEARTPPGSTATFALGGEVELSTIVDIAGNVDELSFGLIIQELIPIFNDFYFTARNDLSVDSADTVDGFDMNLDLPLTNKSAVTAPAIPVNDPNPLVIAAVDLGDLGIIPAGFGIVEEGVASLQTPAPDASVVADGDFLYALVAREGGIDSDAALVYGVLARNVKEFKNVQLPEFLPEQNDADYSAVATVAGTPGAVQFPSVKGADFSFVTVSDGTAEWDVATAADLTDATWPFGEAEVGAPTDALVAGAGVSVQQVGLDFQTFQSLLVDGSSVNLTSYVNDGNRLVVFDGDVQ